MTMMRRYVTLASEGNQPITDNTLGDASRRVRVQLTDAIMSQHPEFTPPANAATRLVLGGTVFQMMWEE